MSRDQEKIIENIYERKGIEVAHVKAERDAALARAEKAETELAEYPYPEDFEVLTRQRKRLQDDTARLTDELAETRRQRNDNWQKLREMQTQLAAAEEVIKGVEWVHEYDDAHNRIQDPLAAYRAKYPKEGNLMPEQRFGNAALTEPDARPPDQTAYPSECDSRTEHCWHDLHELSFPGGRAICCWCGQYTEPHISDDRPHGPHSKEGYGSVKPAPRAAYPPKGDTA